VNRLFYGHASQAMAEYWTFVDDVWAKTPEYAGAAFTYVKRWPPERLTRARSLLDAAKQACATPIETRRVELASDSLALFELYMKMRWDLADGRLRDLGHDAGAWRRKVAALADQYHDQYCFSRLAGMPATLGGVYFQQSYQRTYEDASTIATNFDVLTTPPIRRFRWKTDPERTGERAGWAKPELDDHAWKTTDVCLETWSSLGYHDYFKSMWYRAEVPVPPSHGAKTYLWLSGTDGSAKVFVNGIHVPFVDERGGTRDAFEGFCAPASFDVTAALKTGANSIALFCTRTTLNELGTGGLVGPVLLYREKPRSSGA
jgi:hypothetical protein